MPHELKYEFKSNQIEYASGAQIWLSVPNMETEKNSPIPELMIQQIRGNARHQKSTKSPGD